MKFIKFNDIEPISKHLRAISVESYWHSSHYEANKGVNNALKNQKSKKMKQIW